jgi:hypothetical protein
MSAQIVSKDWKAWNNLQPPGPFRFHIVGEVQVPNPGVLALLYPKVPQGFNAAVLLLELHLFQQPGIWPQHVTWAQAKYDALLPKEKYAEVVVSNEGKEVAKIPVEDIQ